MSIKLNLTILIILLTFSLTACTPHTDTVELAGEQSLTFWFKDIYEYQLFSPVISTFGSQNEDVDITIERFDDLSREEYYTKLQTEIMSGNGPDIIFCNDNLDNIYKVMASGAFYDLNIFLDKDSDYNADDYYTEVLKGGQLDGKQLAVPLSFSLNTLLSTQSQIENTGFSVANCMSLIDFSKELNKLISNVSVDNPISIFGGIHEFHFLPQYLTGELNYSNRSVSIETDSVKKILETYKEAYKLMKNESTEYEIDAIVNNLKTSSSFFEICLSNPLVYAAAINYYETPSIIPRYALNGKLKVSILQSAAINNASDNKETAYHFIKELIFYEDENKNSISFGDFSINKAQTKKAIDFTIDEIQKASNGEANGIAMNDTNEIKALTESLYNEFYQLFEQPMDATMTTNADLIMRQAFISYFKDEISLDECLKELQSKLEIYISE